MPVPPRHLNIVADANIPRIEDLCRDLGNVVLFTPDTVQDLHEVLIGADVFFCRSTVRVDERLLGGTAVRFVATATSGTDHVDMDYLRRNNITFAAAPGSNALSVAEYVFTALFNLSARLSLPLRGASVGIIGVGHVGTRVQHFAERLGMRTILNDPPLFEATGSAVFRPLEEALAADIVTLHVPLERRGPHPTVGMIGEEEFEMMRNGVVFINTSRGGVVDHGALTRAVRRGKTGAVVLDVWPDEPDVDPVLVACADIATPHIAGHSYDGKLLGSVMVFEAFCSWLGRETCLTYTDLLPDMRLEISIRPSGCTPLQCINGIISTAFDIDADDKVMRSMARLREKKRREVFASYRASYHPRREFPAWHVDRSALDAEVVRVIDALGFS